MARGWESKSVESQIESAASRRFDPTVSEPPEQAARQRKRESLELSRTRILRELAAATNPRHRQTLEAALRYLDEKISALV